MKKITVFKHSYNVVRGVIVTAITAMVLLFAISYALLSVPTIQEAIKNQAERELEQILRTDVTVDRLQIKPFNQVVLYGVDIPDQNHKPMIATEKLGAGLSWYNLIFKQKLVITYVELIGMEMRIYRHTKHSPTNIQFLIDALKPKNKTPKRKTELSIHNIVIRQSSVTYDVLDQPKKPKGLDVNHLKFNDIQTDLLLPKISDKHYQAHIKRLSVNEISGLILKNLTALIDIEPTQATLSQLSIVLPNSYIAPAYITLKYSDLNKITSEFLSRPLPLSLNGSVVNPKDFSWVAPQLEKLDFPLTISTKLQVDRERINLANLSIAARHRHLHLATHGQVDNYRNINKLRVDLPSISFDAKASEIATLLSTLSSMPDNTKRIITALGDVNLFGRLRGDIALFDFSGTIASSLGKLVLDGRFADLKQPTKSFIGNISTNNFRIGKLLAKEQLLGDIAIRATVDGKLRGKDFSGKLNANIDHIDLRGYRYTNLKLDGSMANKMLHGTFTMNDPNGTIALKGDAMIDGTKSWYNFDLKANNVIPDRLNLFHNDLATRFSIAAHGKIQGTNTDNLRLNINANSLNLTNARGQTLTIDSLNIRDDEKNNRQSISIVSPLLSGKIFGRIHYATVARDIKAIFAQIFPQLMASEQTYKGSDRNNFVFNLTAHPHQQWNYFGQLPIKLIYKGTLTGHVDQSNSELFLNLNLPYLQQGKKLIENTALVIEKQRNSDSITARITTLIPTKRSKLAVSVNASGVDNQVNTLLRWRVEDKHDYHGDLNLFTKLWRNQNKQVSGEVQLQPAEIFINDSIWSLDGGQVFFSGTNIDVENLKATYGQQLILIDGAVSKDPSKQLNVTLNDIDLDFVFETLNIDNVMFGGRATGTFHGSNLLSGRPRLATPNLHIAGIKYNNALMGDADIASTWNNDNKSVVLNASIRQANGKTSNIAGEIFTTRDSLSILFDADHANVKFMKPFMAAFTSDIDGEVSGRALLYGKFSTIDLKGDISAHNLKMRIDYTNCYYTCSDSVHIEPGFIDFRNIRIQDRFGHTALLNGWLRHDSFHNPKFNFKVTEARDFLVYDKPTKPMDANWYGTIFGNGVAFISGQPGVINIEVNMQSAPKSNFSFVLSDEQVASQYNFITYRNREKAPILPKDSMLRNDTLPEIVKQLKNTIAKKNAGIPTKYFINLQGDITPDMQMTIIMDPVGGDKIKCTGAGNVRMAYDNNDEQLSMLGKYIIEQGNYNFTLQDIIIKDFMIRQGSSISFNGDPYAAVLDLKAIYALNANLRDLDESFATDRDLNRTNVPVHALLYAKGVISQPDISFDIECPTLSPDSYHKVKSIINTDDMMNRQIIYLLALNRFYTPNYVQNATYSNEFTSMASSTISSQLSNLLGQLSDNWSISPNLRTEKGDFSDLEVDLALSSQLLNNRLLLNGNFGYRDNTYSTNNSNFIGDFDLEYLINRSGSIRLKAYNHFNDQNLYFRNALTTQGVGIMFKHEFDGWDSFKNWFRRRKKPATEQDSTRNVQK